MRVATTDAFSYVAPEPGIISALYCHGPGVTMSGSVCNDGNRPIVGSETDAKMPLNSTGTLTITMENVGIVPASTELRVTLGTSSGKAKVMMSAGAITMIDVSFPPGATEQQP